MESLGIAKAKILTIPKKYYCETIIFFKAVPCGVVNVSGMCDTKESVTFSRCPQLKKKIFRWLASVAGYFNRALPNVSDELLKPVRHEATFQPAPTATWERSYGPRRRLRLR